MNNNFSAYIPVLGFAAFLYIFSTMGHPDRAPWDRPAQADPGEIPAAYPRCVNGDATNPENWAPCTPDQLAELDDSRPRIFNTIKGVWE